MGTPDVGQTEVFVGLTILFSPKLEIMQPLYLKLYQVIITEAGVRACLFTPESAILGDY